MDFLKIEFFIILNIRLCADIELRKVGTGMRLFLNYLDVLPSRYGRHCIYYLEAGQ
jgi:hypothetical protein